jgi:hypothetical protein
MTHIFYFLILTLNLIRSDNAGVTVHNSNKDFNEIMIKTMDMLNLKPHLCGMEDESTKVLCSATDIEGHLGTDNKVTHNISFNFYFIFSFFHFFIFFIFFILFFSLCLKFENITKFYEISSTH